MAQIRVVDLGMFNSGNGASWGATAWTTPSFTPPDNSLLVVFADFIPTTDDASTGSTLTITDSAGLTWTSRVATARMPSWSGGSRVWTAPVTTGASMTVTLDAGASNVEAFIADIYAILGYDTVNPVGGTIAGTDADGDDAATITLSATPSRRSVVFGHAHCVTGGGIATTVTPGAGWDEYRDVQLLNRFMVSQTQARDRYQETAVDWLDLDVTGTTNTGAVLIGIEFQAAPDEPVRIKNRYRRHRKNSFVSMMDIRGWFY